jgi:hypothetical protein
MKCVCVMFFFASVVQGTDVTLWMMGEGILSNPVRWAATDEATRIFAAIGVQLKWKAHNSVDPNDGMAIQVRFIANMPGHPGAMAFANPFDPVPAVTVMWDRILLLTDQCPELRTALLAHVLAHEIGHVLMKTDAHSAAGLMKAHWSGLDYGRIVHRRLTFLPDHADMIRRGLGLTPTPR